MNSRISFQINARFKRFNVCKYVIKSYYLNVYFIRRNSVEKTVIKGRNINLYI